MLLEQSQSLPKLRPLEVSLGIGLLPLLPDLCLLDLLDQVIDGHTHCRVPSLGLHVPFHIPVGHERRDGLLDDLQS